MRIVAIRATHVFHVVGRIVPATEMRSVVALETEIGPRFLPDLPMGPVAGGAIKAIGAENLMWMSQFLKLAFV